MIPIILLIYIMKSRRKYMYLKTDFSSLVRELQEQLYSTGFDSDDLCPLIRDYIGHFKYRFMTSLEKYIILGLAIIHLLKEVFQLTQANYYMKLIKHIK